VGARNNSSENIVREYVQGGEHSIGMGVVAEDEEKPKKEEREHMGCGKRVLYRCNKALESIDGGLLRRPRWTIPEMRCKV
jgi:hypothetical protein